PIELPGGRARRYRVEVPAGRWESGGNRVTFRYGRVQSPREVGGPRDDRRLAVAWTGLEVEGAHRADPALLRTGGEPVTLSLPFGLSTDFYLDLPAGAELGLVELRPWRGSDATARLRVAVTPAGGDTETWYLPVAGDHEEGDDLRRWLPVEGPTRVSLAAERGDGDAAGLQLVAPVLRVAELAALPGLEAVAEAAATPPATPAADEPVRRPNVVVYLVDTLRADHLGAYGYPRPTSPRFDRFAEESVLFERAVAQSSWTRPAVATMLTGLHPQSHGTNGRLDALPEALPILPELLRDAGYATAGFFTNGNAGPSFGFARGFDDVVRIRERKDRIVHRRAGEVNGEVFAWLDGRPRDRPFLLWVHVSDPHAPYTPPEKFRQRLAPDVDPDAGLLPRVEALHGAPQEPGTAERMSALYDAEIAYLDDQFGALLDRIDDDGLADDTVVVFIADHGEAFGEHGLWEHGRALYGEHLLVPFAVRLPAGTGTGTGTGTVAGRRVGAWVEQADLMPTLLTLAGLPVPEGVEGHDLGRWFSTDAAAEEGSPNRFAWAHIATDGFDQRAVIGGDWKLIHYLAADAGGSREEVYDLDRDPGERDDLAGEAGVRAGWLRSLLTRARLAWVPRAAVGQGVLDPEEEERLRALGYLQ
ncbi:MAG TPA: sulfatase, partial [Thermoanaerobaculia bacterium]|nr:sulfatase [Thermoanaerobaculia bacterium]